MEFCCRCGLTMRTTWRCFIAVWKYNIYPKSIVVSLGRIHITVSYTNNELDFKLFHTRCAPDKWQPRMDLRYAVSSRVNLTSRLYCRSQISLAINQNIDFVIALMLTTKYSIKLGTVLYFGGDENYIRK